MHVNIDRLIELVENMKVVTDDEDGSLSDEPIHQQKQEKVFQRNKAIDNITEGLTELKLCCENGTWSHFNELSITQNKLKIKYGFGVSIVDWLVKHSDYYFSQNEIRIEELDWLFTDMLIAYSFKRQIDDLESWVAEMCGGAFFYGFLKIIEKQYLAALALVVGKLLIWGIVGAAFLIPLAIADYGKSPLFILISAVVLFHVLRVKYKKDSDYMAIKMKAYESAWAINRVYSLTSTEHIHWDVLQKELDTTREQGVKWLPSLYTAVKKYNAA